MKTYNKYFLYSLFIFLFSFYFNFTFAQTEIYGGVISSDTTWTKEGSPYIIYEPAEGDLPLTIDAGATLTIEAGVIVKFDYYQTMEVSGNLIINGAPDEKVYFTSLYNDSVGGDTDLDEGLIPPYDDDWSGVEILNGGNAELKNLAISYAALGLSYISSTGQIENSTFVNCQEGLRVSENSAVNVSGSNFENIFYSAIQAYSSSSLSVIFSNIINAGEGNAGGGVDVFGESHVFLSSSTVKNVSQFALIATEKSIFDINNITIENAGVAILVFDGIANFANSNINGIYGSEAILVINGGVFNFNNSILKNINSLNPPDNGAFLAYSNDGYDNSALNISSSTISDGKGTGFDILNNAKVNIDKTTIKNFLENGIQISFSSILIANSEISNNKNGIVSFESNVEIKDSIISNNQEYGILNLSTSSLPTKAINNWWGDVSGPYNTDTNISGTANPVYGNVEFSPWLHALPGVKSECCSNILFIPGLESSRLYKDNDGSEKRLWEPELFHDNFELYLDSGGKSNDLNIYTRDIIDNAYLPIKGNIYKSSISSLNELKLSGIINDWEAVPYDWRLSFEDLLSGGKKYSDGKIYYSGELSLTSESHIIKELRRLASTSYTGKVTIIAHSNGGLLTKILTNKLGSEASGLIDKIIFVAVPEAGTPTAIGALLHGFNQGLPKDWLPLFITPSEARTLGNNMPSAYNLLPSSQYFNYINDPVVTFDNSELLASWREKYGGIINSGEGLYNFLSDQSREILPTKNDLVSLPLLNKNLLDSAAELHNTKLDNWTPPEGISLTEIAGWGEETLSGIEYYQGVKSECEKWSQSSTCMYYSTSSVLEYKPIMTYDGDGTVVVPSALWTPLSTGVEKYWVDLDKYNKEHRLSAPLGRQHADILEVLELRTLIYNIITKNSNELPEYISTSAPINSSLDKKLHFILHSPLSLDLYDEQGNHTGISTTTNEVEENIPDSSYMTFGEVKYISVPASSTVHLAMQGYSSGSFTLNIEETQEGAVIASTTFAGVPSSTSTTATINIPGGNIASTSPLLIDENGDDDAEINILPKLGEIVFPDFSKYQSEKITEMPKIIAGGWIPNNNHLLIATSAEIIKKEIISSTTNNISSTTKKELKNKTMVQNIKKTSNIKKKSINKNDKTISTKKSSFSGESMVANVSSVSTKNKISSFIINIINYLGYLFSKNKQ